MLRTMSTATNRADVSETGQVARTLPSVSLASHSLRSFAFLLLAVMPFDPVALHSSITKLVPDARALPRPSIWLPVSARARLPAWDFR
jgi:hypothetical protein